MQWLVGDDRLSAKEVGAPGFRQVRVARRRNTLLLCVLYLSLKGILQGCNWFTKGVLPIESLRLPCSSSARALLVMFFIWSELVQASALFFLFGGLSTFNLF